MVQGTNIYYLGVSSIDTYKLDKAGNDTIEGTRWAVWSVNTSNRSTQEANL
jgi:hypothetical protein